MPQFANSLQLKCTGSSQIAPSQVAHTLHLSQVVAQCSQSQGLSQVLIPRTSLLFSQNESSQILLPKQGTRSQAQPTFAFGDMHNAYFASHEANEHAYDGPQRSNFDLNNLFSHSQDQSANAAALSLVQLRDLDSLPEPGPVNDSRDTTHHSNLGMPLDNSIFYNISNSTPYNTSVNLEQAANAAPTILLKDITEALKAIPLHRISKPKAKSSKKSHLKRDPKGMEDALENVLNNILETRDDLFLHLQDSELCLKIARKLKSKTFTKLLGRVESLLELDFDLEALN